MGYLLMRQNEQNVLTAYFVEAIFPVWLPTKYAASFFFMEQKWTVPNLCYFSTPTVTVYLCLIKKDVLNEAMIP